MYKKIIFTLCIYLLLSNAIAENYKYDINSYTFCLWDNKTESYSSSCKTTNTQATLNFEINDSIFKYKNYIYSIDSSNEVYNSDNELVIAFFLRELETQDLYIYFFNEKYINIVEEEKWKMGFSLVTNDTSYISGSGVGINANNIVTNYHVVENMKSIVVNNGEKYFSAKLLYYDADIDLAVLKVDSIIESCMLNEELLDVGDEVVTYGYPQILKQGQSIKATKGIISSRFGYLDDIKTYQIDASIQTGNSGGPLTHKGKIVGIVVSKLTEGENVNYAIKSIFLSAFLKATKIKNVGNNNFKKCTYLIIGSDK